MTKKISKIEGIEGIRRSYESSSLDEGTLGSNPLILFKKWLEDAIGAGLIEPNAMALATASKTGKPTLRFVLLKGFDENGLYFFTNYKSPKALNIAENPNVAASFFWDSLERQVRIEGVAIKTSDEISNKYFCSRPRISQLSAISSEQSLKVANRDELEKNFNEIKNKYEGEQLVRPTYWGGYVIVPESFEFWQGRVGRLHDRIKFERSGKRWEIKRLSP